MGCLGVKAVCKMLVKSTPGVNFINILHVLFCQYPFAKKSQSQTVIREKVGKAILYEKSARKMVMKLTTGSKHRF